jgi:hypothetical protein
VATTDYLADPADLAAWLGVAADDPKLLAALAASSSRFRGAVRHHVTHVVDDVLTLDGGGRESVLLPAAPVTAISSVELDSALLVEGTDYAWSADGFLRRLGGVWWPDRLRCLRVTYSHGYNEPPEDVAEVVVDLARALYTLRPGVQTLQVGGITTTFGTQAAVGVSQQWTTVVDRYRLNAGERT